MKKLIYIAFAALVTACGGTHVEVHQTTDTATVVETEVAATPPMEYFGDKISEEGAIEATQVLAALGENDSVQLKVKGTVEQVCQAKGCWMTLNTGENNMMVRFKDYGFFVPMNISGKETVIEGIAKVERYSVEELKHYAEDEGKTEDEIAAITEPEMKLSFEATGVIVKDYTLEQATEEEAHEGHDHGDHSGHTH